MDMLGCMRMFVAVVDQGGFAAAGRQLDVSPPVVTRLVAELEQHLGVRLLQRSTRRLALTEAGARYLAQVRELLLQFDEVEASVRADAVVPRGVLRVLAPPSFLSVFLAQQLPNFLQRYPEISVDVSHGFADGADAGHDISVLFKPELPDGDFIAHRLASAHPLLCAAPAYLRRHGMPSHPEQLARHRCIVVNASHAMRRWTLQRRAVPDEQCQLEPPAVLAAPMVDPLLRGAIEGLGIASLPSFAVAPALRSGQLQRVLPDWLAPAFGVYAALPSRKHLPARTRVFLDFLRQHFGSGETDPWLAQLECEPGAGDAGAL